MQRNICSFPSGGTNWVWNVFYRQWLPLSDAAYDFLWDHRDNKVVYPGGNMFKMKDNKKLVKA